MGCPIRTSTDQRLLAAPRGFSQRATSFIASWCQGIHRMPFSCANRGNHPCRAGSHPPCTEAIHTRRTPREAPARRMTAHGKSHPGSRCRNTIEMIAPGPQNPHHSAHMFTHTLRVHLPVPPVARATRADALVGPLAPERPPCRGTQFWKMFPQNRHPVRHATRHAQRRTRT